MRRMAVLVLAVTLLCSCASLDARLVGKYKCAMKAKTGYDGPGSDFVQAIGNALMSGTLELKSDRTFSIVMMGMPASGTWQVESGKVKLTPDASVTEDPRPLLFELSGEGDTLTTSQDKLGRLVFSRQR